VARGIIADMTYTTQRPFLAAFVIMRRSSDAKVAFIKRHNTGWMDGYYGLPAGKVEQDEPCVLGAVREAKEEAGVDLKPQDLRHKITIHRNEQSKVPLWMDVYFEASAWAGEPYNAEPEASSELAWLDLDDLPDNIVEAQRYALEQIKKGEQYGEFGWEQQLGGS